MDSTTLYVIATPIGHLGDITLRAIEILKIADIILAEDTRRTYRLLSHLGIQKKSMLSYHRFNEYTRIDQLFCQKKECPGKIALVTDAGTPAISDPGQIIVQKAYENGMAVIPIPGASSLSATLSICGIAYQEVRFLGFLPKKKLECQVLISSWHRETALILFYLPGRQIKSILQLMIKEKLFKRPLFIAREMTKYHEEYPLFRDIRAANNWLISNDTHQKGEFTVAFSGKTDLTDVKPDPETIQDIRLLWKAGISRKDITRLLQKKASRNFIYKTIEKFHQQTQEDES